MNVRGKARNFRAAGLGPKEDDVCHSLSGRTQEEREKIPRWLGWFNFEQSEGLCDLTNDGLSTVYLPLEHRPCILKFVSHQHTWWFELWLRMGKITRKREKSNQDRTQENQCLQVESSPQRKLSSQSEKLHSRNAASQRQRQKCPEGASDEQMLQRGEIPQNDHRLLAQQQGCLG